MPPEIVNPDIDALTPESTRNTPLALLPLIVTPPDGPVIVWSPLVLLRVSWLDNVIVSAVPPEANSIVLAPVVEFAEAIAWRKSDSPVTGVSV